MTATPPPVGGGSGGSVVDVGVPAPRAGAACSSERSNSRLSVRWERDSCRFVPQSWYATNRSSSRPTPMSTRPIPPTIRLHGTDRRYGGLWSFARDAGSVAAIPMDPVVHLRDAVCLLNRFPALAGVDLDVAAGEVLLVTGPNGAGKTTLLRALAGLVPFTTGEAVVLGHDLRRDRRTVRREVALVGHGAALYDDLTVVENVRFWAGASPRDATDVAAVAALDRARVDARLRDVVAARLSAGQR